MKKLWKWIVGLFTFIVGILVLSGKKNKRVKEIKKDIKSNKKKTKSIDKKILPSEIITSHLNSKPTVKVLGSEQNYRFLASLTHENEFAIAVIISEKII